MNAIVSVTRDLGIGREGRLLVRNPADMRRFRELTTGGTVVMGRKTFESFPKGALPCRRNIVLTRDSSWTRPGIEVLHGVDEVADATAGTDPAHVWLIGGAELYRQMIGCCERAYVTFADIVIEADAFFPDLDADAAWEREEVSDWQLTPDGVRFRYITYVRRA